IDGVFDIIQTLPPLCANATLAWRETSDGRYSNASAYCRILQVQNPRNAVLFLAVWKWKSPERMHCLLWKLSHEILLTNAERDSKFATGLFC
ncbi:putative ribonuclease H protein, partial [Trifolium medium]|nr:putative ribonuclease H protein [Trifolium medium]